MIRPGSSRAVISSLHGRGNLGRHRVSDILGSDTQNAYLIDVQAHFNLGGELRNARRSARIEGQLGASMRHPAAERLSARNTVGLRKLIKPDGSQLKANHARG